MSKSIWKWVIILFAILPFTYCYTFISFVNAINSGRLINYVLFVLFCIVIITINILIIKEINKGILNNNLDNE